MKYKILLIIAIFTITAINNATAMEHFLMPSKDKKKDVNPIFVKIHNLDQSDNSLVAEKEIVSYGLRERLQSDLELWKKYPSLKKPFKFNKFFFSKQRLFIKSRSLLSKYNLKGNKFNWILKYFEKKDIDLSKKK